MEGVSRWLKQRKVPSTLLRETSREELPSSRGTFPGLSECSPVCSFPDGIKVLHDCPDAEVDICFVHGLTGNRDNTWTARGHSMPWPKTLLPSHLHHVRILTYGYDAYIVRKSVASSNRLIDHAVNLLSDLTDIRASENASSRPLIFVVHSLGGLVCKKAILLSRNNPETHLRGIFDCVKGVMFMGTPHKGAWMADWAKIPASALGIVKSTNFMLLDILQTSNQLLDSIQVEFLAMIRELRESGRGLEITCFFEELPLSYGGKVVSQQSATFDGYHSRSIHANHRDMVKFASEEENGFRRVLGEMSRWTSRIVESPPSNAHRAVSVEQHIDSENISLAHSLEPSSNMNQAGKEFLSDSMTELLPRITLWARSPHGKCVFWLNGIAGPEKSAISKMVENSLREANLLGASFFFKKGDPDRGNAKKLILTITSELVMGRIPQARPRARKAFVDEADLMSKSLKEQFDKLLFQPLQSLESNNLQAPPLVIVIDALDECDRDEDVRTILQLLPRLQELKAVRMRIFLTSWSELPVRLGLSTTTSRERELWNSYEIPEPAQEREISLETWRIGLPPLEGHSYSVESVAFSRDSKLLASASDDDTVRLWDAATGTLQRTLEGHSSWINSVTFSPDGQLLASGSNDNTIQLWKTATGALQQTFEGHSSSVNSVAFSPDGRLLASCSGRFFGSDSVIRLWDVTKGSLQRILRGHSSVVHSVAFSPNGVLLASASRDKTVRLWDAATGTLQRTLEGHSSWINSVTFSPDGQLLASGFSDCIVRLWDTTTCRLHHTLEGHSYSVRSVAFSPDSQLLASASNDNTVRIWNATTGALLHILEDNFGAVKSVTFSPNGQSIAFTSGETVRLWARNRGVSKVIEFG